MLWATDMSMGREKMTVAPCLRKFERHLAQDFGVDRVQSAETVVE